MDIDIDCLAGSYRSIIEFFILEDIDVSKIEKFHYHFKGQQVSYPMKLYDRELTAEKIKSLYKENNEVDVRELTDKYGFSTRWVKNVIKEAKEELNEQH